jgi:DNA polymerase III epsilon subunit-like protein
LLSGEVENQLGLDENSTPSDAFLKLILLLSELKTFVHDILDSDDETLNELSEIVAYIKDNRDFIQEIDFPKVELYYNIGVSMLAGDGVTKDIPKALEYLEFCAENLDVRAIYRLAEYYESQNLYIKAYNRFLKASYFRYKDSVFRKESLEHLADEEQKKKEEAKRRREEEQRRRERENAIPKILFFDTETTGLPPKGFEHSSYNRTDIWPRLVQIGWVVADENGTTIKKRSEIIRPDGFIIPFGASNVHGITTETAMKLGVPLVDVLREVYNDMFNAKVLVAHNFGFDHKILGAEFYRHNIDTNVIDSKKHICTMLSTTNYCKLLPIVHGEYKWPKLEELHYKLFGYTFSGAHDALADVEATMKCYFELKKKGIL